MINKTPGVRGGDACVRDTRITVWGMVEWFKLGATDEELMIRCPGVTQEDIDEAWNYWKDHEAEIEAAIRRNREA
jgi:uncharacterized protein (DUF433 family)